MVTGLTGNGVFNLASQRLFAISAAGVQHYSLNISVGQLDPNVGCRVLSVALTALFLPSGQAAGPVLTSQNPCTYSFGVCLEFNADVPPPKVLRALDFNAPSAGHALVSVHGSGICAYGSDKVEAADFATQITNRPNAVAAYTGNGGNRFAYTIRPKPGNEVFNLAAQRLFAIGGGGVQHYSLNIHILRLDGGVPCDLYSVALTVLFVPN